MRVNDPRALYIYCDGSMNYDSKNSGGVGFEIVFPDFLQIENIRETFGRYVEANIERLEIEGLIKAMEAIEYLFKERNNELKTVGAIIFITDRFRLQDSDGTNPYAIRQWRSKGWKNHEGKPIKNHDLLDKKRKKISELSFKRVSIEYRPRKKNKVADKLAKAGKNLPVDTKKIAVIDNKIGKRKFDGAEVTYKTLKEGTTLHIHVYKKTPVGKEWEIFCEICSGEKVGQRVKVYVDDSLAAKLKRMNQFNIRLKNVHKFHVRIYRTLKRVSPSR